LIQIKPSALARPDADWMARYDWVHILAIATLAVSAGAIGLLLLTLTL
jgi:hypothetical protein